MTVLREQSSEQRIEQAFARVKRGLWIVGIFSLFLNLLMLSVPLYMTAVYDRVLSSRSVETLMALTIIGIGALVLVGILESVRQVILNRLGAGLETALGDLILATTLGTSRANQLDVQGLRDLSQVRQFLSSPLVGTMFDIPVSPFYLAVLFIIHPDLGWITVGACVIIVLVSVANQALTGAPMAVSAKHGFSALHKAQVQVRNSETVRAMGMQRACAQSWAEDNARSLSAAEKAGFTNALLSGMSRFLRLLLQMAILGYGAWLVLADPTIGAGIIFAASIISARALGPLDQVIGGWRTIIMSQQAWQRLKAGLAQISKTGDKMDLAAPDARITADKVYFGMAVGTEAILKGLSFDVVAGDVIGIIGPSGAGKSTLARILVGALPASGGLVRIGGDDIRNWHAEMLGPHIGYLAQDVELFPASVAQNIARMAAEPDAEKVANAAKAARCYNMIQKLPNGFDTKLGAEGHALSGGQRQRVALARALYGDPRILVLDEPNASLDTEGEHALLTAIKDAATAGAACIVITQRQTFMPAVTKLMILNEGRIIAFGPRDDVIREHLQPPAENGARKPEKGAGISGYTQSFSTGFGSKATT